jgi:hypothetical protein
VGRRGGFLRPESAMFVSEKGKGVMALGSIDVDECMTMDVFFLRRPFLSSLRLEEGARGDGAGGSSFLGYAYAHEGAGVFLGGVRGFSMAFRRGSGCAGLGFALGC